MNQQRSNFFLLDFPRISPAVHKSNITVSWNAPFDGECPVTSYTVYYRMMESRMTTSAWKEVTVSKYQLQITLQLKCHKTYEIEVTAWSSFGETSRNQSKVVPTWGGMYFQNFEKSVHSMLLFAVYRYAT